MPDRQARRIGHHRDLGGSDWCSWFGPVHTVEILFIGSPRALTRRLVPCGSLGSRTAHRREGRRLIIRALSVSPDNRNPVSEVSTLPTRRARRYPEQDEAGVADDTSADTADVHDHQETRRHARQRHASRPRPTSRGAKAARRRQNPCTDSCIQDTFVRCQRTQRRTETSTTRHMPSGTRA